MVGDLSVGITLDIRYRTVVKRLQTALHKFLPETKHSASDIKDTAEAFTREKRQITAVINTVTAAWVVLHLNIKGDASLQVNNR